MVLTFSIIFIEDISVKTNNKVDISRICSRFSGCETLSGYQNNCVTEPLLCHGSRQCCNDCHNVWKENVDINEIFTSKGNINITSQHTIKFTNTYSKLKQCLPSGGTIVILMHFLLLILIRKHKQAKISNTVLKWLICITMVSTFVISLGLSLYSFGYLFTNLKILLKCQPMLFILVSWCWVLCLFVLEFVIDIVPRNVVQINKHNKMTKIPKEYFNHNTTSTTYIALKCLRVVLTPILVIIKILEFIWWVFVYIYLTWVVFGK